MFDTPLAESAIVGTAIGMAMNGLRPVVEMQFDAFAYPAFEQITSHLAKLRNRTRGAISLPIVIRVPYGGGIGGVEHHCDSSEAYYTHTPGLRVVTPGHPGRRLPPAAPGHRLPGPGDLPRAQAPVLVQGGRRAHRRRAGHRPGRGGRAGRRRHPDQLRRHGGDRAGGGRGRAPRKAGTSRSSTCAACPRSTTRRSPPRSGAPAGPWSSTRRPGSAATAPRSWPG